MFNDDHVCDDEVLYRKVPNQKGVHYVPIGGGRHRVSSAAFDDKANWKISVNRAKLHGNNPEHSKTNPTDLVISLEAGRVRGIEGFGTTIDVAPDPNPPEDPDNEAHALIVADDQFPSRNQFDKFTRALARIANSNWAIPPPNAS